MIIIVLRAFCFLKECYVKIRQAVYILFSKLPLLLINGELFSPKGKQLGLDGVFG